MRVSSIARGRTRPARAGSSARSAKASGPFSIARRRRRPGTLLQRKRLHEVVVGARVQTGQAIRDGVARGEQEHPCGLPPHEPAAGGEAVEPRIKTSDDGVRALARQRLQALVAGGGEFERVAVQSQRAFERVDADGRFVVDTRIRMRPGCRRN